MRFSGHLVMCNMVNIMLHQLCHNRPVECVLLPAMYVIRSWRLFELK